MKYFIYTFYEYYWNGRSEWKKQVVRKNLTKEEAEEIKEILDTETDATAHIERMENLDDSFE